MSRHFRSVIQASGAAPSSPEGTITQPMSRDAEAASDPPAKRLSLSAIIELMLTRGAGDRSAVTLTRTSSGGTAIDVKVRTGDDGELLTVEQAASKAAEVFDALTERYPESVGHENAAVSLTRNAKGETQIDVTARTSDGGETTLAGLAKQAAKEYDAARRAYPMANGHTAKPGTVA
jgi:hypothetical protein